MHRNVMIDEKLIQISIFVHSQIKSTGHNVLQNCGPSVRLMRYFLKQRKRRDHLILRCLRFWKIPIEKQHINASRRYIDICSLPDLLYFWGVYEAVKSKVRESYMSSFFDVCLNFPDSGTSGSLKRSKAVADSLFSRLTGTAMQR